MIEFLNNIDTEIFLFFNGLHCSYLDKLMPLVTAKFTWVPMYATLIFMLYRGYTWKQGVALLLGIVLAVALSDQITSSLIRPAVDRLRPTHPDNPLSQFVHMVNGYRGGRNGFPSAHASNSFALAMIGSLIVRHRRFTFFVFFWAIIHSYSRLYLGVHYPGDLACGALIGLACGAGVYYLTCYVARIPRLPYQHTTKTLVYTIEEVRMLGTKAVNIRALDTFTVVGCGIILALCLLALVGRG